MFDDLPEFTVVVRGYDRQQVDDYVRTLRDYVDEITTRVRSAENTVVEQAASGSTPAESPSATADFDALGQHIVAILKAAQDAAEQTLADARTHASSIIERASHVSMESDGTTERVRADADQIRAAARDEAEAMLSRSREHSERTAAELLAQAEAEAGRLRDHGNDMAQARAHQLRGDIESLERRHAEAKAALATLRSMLDTAHDPTTTT